MNAWRKWLAGVGLATGMVCAGDALAEQERLTVVLSSEPAVMPHGYEVRFHADVPDRSGTECRYEQERILEGAPQLLSQSGWAANCAVSGNIGDGNGPGVFLIRVLSRDTDNPTDVMMKERVVVFLGQRHPDYWPRVTELRTQVWENYRHAFRTIRDTLASVKAKLQAGQSVDEEYAWFASGTALITSLLNPDNRSAPSGGNAFVDGPGDDRTGAIGVAIHSAPVSPTDWSDVTVAVDLPNYSDLDVNGDLEKLLLWDDIPLN